jgi:hypothetical protein
MTRSCDLSAPLNTHHISNEAEGLVLPSTQLGSPENYGVMVVDDVPGRGWASFAPPVQVRRSIHEW